MGVPHRVDLLDKRNEVMDATASHRKLRCFFNPPPPVPLDKGINITAAYVKSKGRFHPTVSAAPAHPTPPPARRSATGASLSCLRPLCRAVVAPFRGPNLRPSCAEFGPWRAPIWQGFEKIEIWEKMPRSWVTALKEWKNIIPILSISVSSDQNGKLLEMLRSIDFPVKRILVQVGNTNVTVINKIMHAVKTLADEVPKYLKAVELKRLRIYPGTAQGYNHGLRAMMGSDAEWALMVRPGTVFEPGALKKATAHLAQHLRDDPMKFGVGFSAGESASWGAFAMTRRLVQKVGYFDENFYPAGMEAADMANRVRLAGFYGKNLQNVHTTHHSESAALELLEVEEVAKRANSGASSEYYARKWGGAAECADLVAPACSAFHTPFNEPSRKLREWSIEPHRRAWIISGKARRPRALALPLRLRIVCPCAAPVPSPSAPRPRALALLLPALATFA